MEDVGRLPLPIRLLSSSGTPSQSHVLFVPPLLPTMVLGLVSLFGIVGAVALIFALGFGLLYLLWTLLQPPDPPADGSTDNA
jgi:hypothetical protein